MEVAAAEPQALHSDHAVPARPSRAVATPAGRAITPDPARDVNAAAVAAPPAATPSPVPAPGEPASNTGASRIEELLLLANRALERDRLSVPKQQNAWYYYREVLALDPDNKAAQDGFARIAARYHELAMYALQKQALDKAQRYIQRGLGVEPGDSSLLALQEEVHRQHEALEAKREQEQLLARGDSAEVDPQPEPAGLFGFLKTVFTGNNSDQ